MGQLVTLHLGLRATPSALERPLGKLLRTFFFHAAVPSLRPERWALVAAVMLQVVAVRGIPPGEPDDRSPTLVRGRSKTGGRGAFWEMRSTKYTSPPRRFLLCVFFVCRRRRPRPAQM